MTPLYVQSDFASPDETLAQYHHRVCASTPRGPIDWLCVGLIATSCAVSLLVIAYLLLVIA